MGNGELLALEDAVALAKRIEATEQLHSAVAQSSLNALTLPMSKETGEPIFPRAGFTHSRCDRDRG
jgi:hypothetical protein